MGKFKNNNSNTSSAGFTLIEIAVIVTIASLVLVTGVGLLNTWITQSQLAKNEQRLLAIQRTINNYVTQRNRLPCPASFRSRTSDAIYGREVVPVPASCAAGVGVNPNGNDTYAAIGRAGAPVIIGTVPVRDLGLPDSYLSNVYGYAYTYAITRSLAAAPINGANGAIDVVNNAGVTVLPGAGTATYVVVDHGKDGKGAFTANSSAAALGTFPPAKACASTAGLDQLNCNYSGANPVRFRSTPFSQQTGAAWFDDSIVHSATRSTNAQTCTTQYSNSATSGTSGGFDMAGQDIGGSITGLYNCFFLICAGGGWYYDELLFAPSPSSFNRTSPTAIAYCPRGSNVITGGCTQTFGTPVNAGNAAITATVSASGTTYNGPIANVNAARQGIYTADLGPNSNMQLVQPPLSHPTMPNAAGQQGWECNGSSASGMFTQAYAVCCTGGG